FAEPFLDHIAGGVYLRQNSQEALEWLDSIQDKSIAEKARNIIARRYGSDPIISRVIAEGISDPELRAATFESIENKQRYEAIEFGPNH
ncbi:hypothetical protein, partial [Rubritalea halochordaticola]|uniref:hypothetical protein n=1 Tax=Rubritalea halochordaticola TaxID=714537 RepID=UPI0031FD2BBE